MKTKYRLTKNGVYSGDYDTENTAMARACELEGVVEMLWREGDEFMFSFGEGSIDKRNEYEVRPTRVSTAIYR